MPLRTVIKKEIRSISEHLFHATIKLDDSRLFLLQLSLEALDVLRFLVGVV